MADRAQRYGMDPEDMRRVIISIGQPRPARASLPALSIPRRTLMLLILLGLVGILGLTSAHGMAGAGIVTALAGLEGDRAEREPVKKGSGGARDIQITPLEKLEMESPSALRQLYNFLQIFPIAAPLAQEAHAAPSQPRPRLVMPKSTESTFFDQEPRKPGEPMEAIVALGFFALIILWLHLRARGAAADRNWRNRK